MAVKKGAFVSMPKATAKFRFKKPDKPYKKRTDGHTYVRLNGGPLEGGWLRNYPPMQETFSALGAEYILRPNDVIDPEFPEDRQIGFTFIGYAQGME